MTDITTREHFGEERRISPYVVQPAYDSLLGQRGGVFRTAGPVEQFISGFYLRDGFSVHDSDPTFGSIDAPECLPSGCVAAVGSLAGSCDRDDYE